MNRVKFFKKKNFDVGGGVGVGSGSGGGGGVDQGLGWGRWG